jgi:hypothetical protein
VAPGRLELVPPLVATVITLGGMGGMAAFPPAFSAKTRRFPGREMAAMRLDRVFANVVEACGLGQGGGY